MAELLNFRSRWGRLFNARDLKGAYQTVFRSTPGAEMVLPDIAEFCWAGEPIPHGMKDPFELGRWAGRQDVYYRIADNIHLDEEELQLMHQHKSIFK